MKVKKRKVKNLLLSLVGKQKNNDNGRYTNMRMQTMAIKHAKNKRNACIGIYSRREMDCDVMDELPILRNTFDKTGK